MSMRGKAVSSSSGATSGGSPGSPNASARQRGSKELDETSTSPTNRGSTNGAARTSKEIVAPASSSAVSYATTIFYMSLNFAVSVLIVWVNKFAFQQGFRWNISLTTLHFLFTYIGLEISARFFNLFEPVKIPARKVAPMCAAFCGFVVFNNLSLQYNPVGVYQLLKVLTTPVIVVLQKATLPTSQMLALIPTCVGVVLATVTHLDANLLGGIFGTLGILSTSFYQIWVKSEQDALKVSAPQLLYNQSFWSFWALLLLSPFVEEVFHGPDPLVACSWASSPLTLVAVVGSAGLAFLVNLSIFLVIGKTDAVSYNVLGHAKLCCILISGYLVFGETATWKNLAGVGLAVCGIVTYTHLKITAGQSAATAGKKGK
ncbi:unnamed protein product [Amoebophrya sp. A120]|nr:unnamed protein product [Amoebophrya sp. A120]|eukprot:GSA120T00019215001.1